MDLIDHPRELAGCDHTGFVNHEHIAGLETVAALRPGVRPRGQCAASDPGALRQTFRRLAGQRPTEDPLPAAIQASFAAFSRVDLPDPANPTTAAIPRASVT